MAHYLTQHLNRFGKKRRSDRPSEIDFKAKGKQGASPLKGWRRMQARTFTRKDGSVWIGHCVICEKEIRPGDEIAYLPRTRGFAGVTLCFDCFSKPSILERIDNYRCQR